MGAHEALPARCRWTTGSAAETLALGIRCGALLQAPVVLALIGDLGSGKTVFVQGLARGLGLPENWAVTSPTFTFINAYPGRLPLFHVDLYRLDDAAAGIEELGLAEILDGNGVVAIEWAEKLPRGEACERMEIRFTLGSGENDRILDFGAYGQVARGLLNALNSGEAANENMDGR